MKKRLAIFLGVVFGVTMLIQAAALAEDKFAYVDLSRLFSEYNKTKEYDKVLSEKERVYGVERDKKVNDIKQFQDKVNLLSEKEKEAKKQELESKVKGLQEYDRQQQTDLRKEQNERMKEILKDIEVAVKQHAEKEGYTMVFNDRVLVYQTKNLDITDKIVEILNKSNKR
jgi:Skp family chaperone for outer membrane proteins